MLRGESPPSLTISLPSASREGPRRVGKADLAEPSAALPLFWQYGPTAAAWPLLAFPRTNALLSDSRGCFAERGRFPNILFLPLRRRTQADSPPVFSLLRAGLGTGTGAVAEIRL